MSEDTYFAGYGATTKNRIIFKIEPNHNRDPIHDFWVYFDVTPKKDAGTALDAGGPSAGFDNLN